MPMRRVIENAPHGFARAGRALQLGPESVESLCIVVGEIDPRRSMQTKIAQIRVSARVCSCLAARGSWQEKRLLRNSHAAVPMRTFFRRLLRPRVVPILVIAYKPEDGSSRNAARQERRTLLLCVRNRLPQGVAARVTVASQGWKALPRG